MSRFVRPQVTALQQVVTTDLHRVGNYTSYAIQEMMDRLLRDGSDARRDGFFGDGFEVEGIAGSYDVNVKAGWGFRGATPGSLGARESEWRVLWLESDRTVSTGAGAPTAGTYYVHATDAEADGDSESRLVRPSAGASFATSSVNTSYGSVPTIFWSTLPSVPNHVLLATVTVPAAPADSTAYTFVDERPSLSTVTRSRSVPMTGIREIAAAGAATTWQYSGGGLSYVWNAASSAVEVDIPVAYGDDASPSFLSSIDVLAATSAASDLQAQVFDHDLAALSATAISGVTALGASAALAWYSVPLTGSATSTECGRVFAKLTPTGTGYLVAIRANYTGVRYLGPC